MKKVILIIISILLVVLIGIVVINIVNNTNKEEIADNWVIKITPIYLDSPSNQLLIYEDYYIITYSFSHTEDLVYHKGKIDNEQVENIKKAMLEQLQSSDEEEGYPFYVAEFYHNNTKMNLYDVKRDIIDIVEEALNYNGKIWYVTPDD